MSEGSHAPATVESSSKSSSELLQDSGQKARQLCHILEQVSDSYRDMREQIKPLQEEYARRLDECKFLEAQCRRLDVHCRLLEERAGSLRVLSSRPSTGGARRAPSGGLAFNAALTALPACDSSGSGPP